MLISLIRSVILYFILVVVIRLLGKRQLAEMEPSEFVVTLLIADLATVPMQDLEAPLLTGVVPILTVLAAEVFLSALSYYSISFRKLLCGRPVILMENGVINQKNLRRTRITPDELTELLREKEILKLSDVKYAILETNGQISVLRDDPQQPQLLPFTIISSGTLLRQNLLLSGHDERWLNQLLRRHQCRMQDVFLLTVNSAEHVFLALKEQPNSGRTEEL